VSQAEPRELTNRRTRQRVTAIAHDQRTPTSSLPVMRYLRGDGGAEQMAGYGRVRRWLAAPGVELLTDLFEDSWPEIRAGGILWVWSD
jgi:hypothetical protein